MTRLFFLIALIAAFALSLASGKTWIAPADWFADNAGGWIMLELRLPRAILGASIGAMLGLSGAVLQGYLRNPLADPTIVGVSASAALGGVIAILFGLTAIPFGMFGCAMAGAALAVVLLGMIAPRSGGPLGFILGGVILSTLAGSLTALCISLSPNPFATSEIISWLMGALTDRTMPDVAIAVPFIAAGSIILLTTGRAIDALTLGEDSARSLGIDMAATQRSIAIGTGIGVGAAVAVSGVVGFVGLIVPHIVRSFSGERPSATLFPSAIGGAILLLIADSLVRLAPGPSEVRLGIAMTVIGAPLFLIIMARMRTRAL